MLTYQVLTSPFVSNNNDLFISFNNGLKLAEEVERRQRVEVPLREVTRGTVTSEGVKKDKQTTFPYLWHQLILSGTVCSGRASALSG